MIELTTLSEITTTWGQNGCIFLQDEDTGCVYELESIEEILEYFYDDRHIVTG